MWRSLSKVIPTYVDWLYIDEFLPQGFWVLSVGCKYIHVIKVLIKIPYDAIFSRKMVLFAYLRFWSSLAASDPS